MTSDCAQRREILIAFGKLGEMLRSGVPLLDAFATVAEECMDRDVTRAFTAIHERASRNEDIRGVLSEFGDLFPKSVQWMWRAGNIGNASCEGTFAECCRRAAAILDLEFRHR
jgi:type II secretory pathway component PulF